MTREEANRILIGYVKACNEDDLVALERFSYEEVIEAMRIGAETLSESSLPSDLDEAAFTYENELWESGYKNCGYSPQEVNAAFKAGAEWMAGQGVCADAEVCKLADRAWVTPLDEKLFQNEVYDKFKAGDKVVAQIRKK